MLPAGLGAPAVRRNLLALAAALLVVVLLVVTAPPISPAAAQSVPAVPPSPTAQSWIVLSWNDLGMHCYNRDFQDLAVLPPYNTLWSQVIRVGDPPQIITDTVRVAYSFPNNTYSVGKTNFWDYALPLFGKNLAPDIGLTGRGLAGEMGKAVDHFIADGIPLTEFQDSAPSTAYPYQLATVIARDRAGAELARTVTVAPVSTEMHCDYCHYDGGVEEIATGRIETNILTLHDREHAEEYPPGFGSLMDSRPVLCAACHASNALGAPGQPEIPNLSKAMHSKHAEVEDGGGGDGALGDTALAEPFCYNCHPGPQTKCLRDVMSQRGMTCTDCHGSMTEVAQNPDPWLNEPRCDGCHQEPQYAQDQPLYRMSTGHGGVRCSGCHDSPHAIAQSGEPNDAIKFIGWQGHAGTLATCTVCHATTPDGPGPHGVIASPSEHLYLPNLQKGPN